MNARTLAVMQPYVFPYIGYFNLLKSCNVFILYDDVNYIKQGWINRNRVLSANGELNFSVPLAKQSSHLQINEVKVAGFERFKGKFLKSIEQCYSKAKYFEVGLDYINDVFKTDVSSISELASCSIISATQRFGINCEILTSSLDFPQTKGMERSQRLISMAKMVECSRYINSENGSFLYNKDDFLNEGVELKFIRPKLLPYQHFNAEKFIPGLSIIDMMMNLSSEEIAIHLDSYELL